MHAERYGVIVLNVRFPMDHLTKEQRHRNMAANKGKGTKLELLFGKLLWNAGIRYRKNDKSIFGKPDFVITKHKIAIFCKSESRYLPVFARLPMAFVRSIHALTDKTKLLLPAVSLIVPNTV